jgi:hypothetical protein
MSAYPNVAGPSLDSDPALAQLLEQLRVSHNDAICCTLIYGSCLRSGDIYDGLLDLYLICDSYRAAYHRPLLSLANWILPPNVFYAELKAGDKTLRSKVTMISLRDFQRGCSRRWYQSYIWGRFAQPTRILYSRDEQTHATVENALLQAARTLLSNAAPALPPTGHLTTLWEQALGLSYSTELRTERNGRASELVKFSHDFFATVTRHHADSLGFPFTVYDAAGETYYKSEISQSRRRLCGLAWSLRQAQGKLLSILRLAKALFTFEGGLDYFAWKVQRHSGEEIVIPDKVRRAPLIFIWGFCWGLYRRGIFK